MGWVDAGKGRGQEIEAEVGPPGPGGVYREGPVERHWAARATWACD